MANLLLDITQFCERHGLAETTFGHLALGDKPFVKQLRAGRRVWPETEQKVRDFMAAYVPPQSAQAEAAE